MVPRVLVRRGPLLMVLAALAGCGGEEPARQAAPPAPPPSELQPLSGGSIVELPEQAGPWERPREPRRVTAETIFDYMDGGGELYLAYRFRHLDIYEYRAPDASLGTILVELYAMASPDDAYGLLSNDWSGEPLQLADEAASPGGYGPLALYGAGLLRLSSGDLYARVLASRESPSSRRQVEALGRAIVAGREPAPPPAILSALPPSGAGRALRRDRTVFFRSHLVLNSAYFLASADILALGNDVDGVTAEYRKGPGPGERPLRLIVVNYPGPERAALALRTFRVAYIPEAAGAGVAAEQGSARTEQGWVAYRHHDRTLAIALDAGSAGSALAAVGQVAAR